MSGADSMAFQPIAVNTFHVEATPFWCSFDGTTKVSCLNPPGSKTHDVW